MTKLAASMTATAPALFRDRHVAGHLLTALTQKYKPVAGSRDRVVVFALSRSAFPVANAVAKSLDAPLLALGLWEVVVRREGATDGEDPLGDQQVVAVVARDSVVAHDREAMNKLGIREEKLAVAIQQAVLKEGMVSSYVYEE